MANRTHDQGNHPEASQNASGQDDSGKGKRKSLAEQDIIDLSNLDISGSAVPQSTYELRGAWYLIFTVMAVASGIFHFWFAGGPAHMTALQLRPLHTTIILVFTFILYPAFKKDVTRNHPTVFDMLWAAIAVAGGGWLFFNLRTISYSFGRINPEIAVLGAAYMLVMIEAGRRVVGNFMLAFAGIFIAYLFVGPWMPGIFRHAGFSVERVVSHMYTSLEGIFGIALGVSATYVYLFIIFGSFLQQSGTTQVFADLALGLTGASAGGPAKVAVIASGLMGAVQGSSAANVATTGLFTIPLMKSLGFKAHFAAAVEAVASTGGQFLPPVMGASAFIMAQYLGRSYAFVAAGALLPALVYYAAVYLQVHLRAKRTGMKGIDRRRLPAVSKVLLRKGHLLLPIFILVGMIVVGYTALYSAFYSIISIFVISSLRKETRMSLSDIIDGFRMAGKSIVTTSVACAVIGFVVGSVALSGLGMLITQQVIRAGGGVLLPTLLIAAASSLVLSFGLPTTSVYIITATLVAPGLVEAGLPPLAAHLFAYYWGGVSAITPPVALAVFVACGIAGSDLMKTGFTAMRLGIAGYVVPFYFAFWPMLVTRDAPAMQIAGAVVGALLTVVCLAGIGEGWLFRRLSWFKYVLLFVGAPLLIAPWMWTQVAGTIVVAFVVASEYIGMKLDMKREGAALPA